MNPSGPENFKKSRPKNSWNQINRFHKKIFFTKFHLFIYLFFLQFQIWPKIIFWTGKMFKTAKNAISWKKDLIYLISWVFLPGLFLNFLVCCAISGIFRILKLTFSSPLISTLICNRMAPETLDLSERFSKLYHTSISPERVLTSIMVWPKKSSDSRVNFWRNLDFKSLSSSQTRTLIRSEELWHSLKRKKGNF